jgi:hypothetical protein
MMASAWTWGGAFVGAALGALFSGPVVSILDLEPAFMEVHGIEYDGNVVRTDRTIYGVDDHSVIADWSVTVVPNDRNNPSCQTTPGPDRDQGWSEYFPSERIQKTLPFDIWVGDARGCWDRLTPGEYTVHVSWTPRDGGKHIYNRGTLVKPEAGV